jgi:pimeloyl-ACP methyl ester carboxylesterase
LSLPTARRGYQRSDMRRVPALMALLLTAASFISCAGGNDALAREKKKRGRRPLGTTVAVGCTGAKLPKVPTDTAARGPFAVGLKTVRAAGVTADVYYPAAPASAEGKPAAAFDLREHLPAELAERIKDAKLIAVPCNCSRDLPIDAGHGPYPVVFFFHGRGLTRAEFPTLCAHLASRGFVVVSPDLPGVHLSDYFEREKIEYSGDTVGDLVKAVKQTDGELAFLAGRLDGRVGLVGHSMGAYYVQRIVDEFGSVAVVMGARGLDSKKPRLPKLILGGTADGFAPFAGQKRGYAATMPPKRLVGAKGAGHMQYSDHCNVSPEFGGWYGAAVAYGVPFSGFLLKLAEKGCADAEVPYQQAHAVFLAATTAQLEETLTCSPTAAQTLEELEARPDVEVYEQDVE